MDNDVTLRLPPLPPKGKKRLNIWHRILEAMKKLWRFAKNACKWFLSGKAWKWFLAGKPFWDILNILGVIAVPIVIAIVTMQFSAQQSQTNNQIANDQQKENNQIAQDQQKENNRIAQDQQRETALQAYLDHMTDLLLNNKLRESQPGDEVRNVARARTLTVLSQLDGGRKGAMQ
jgi:hypothetical protein